MLKTPLAGAGKRQKTGKNGCEWGTLTLDKKQPKGYNIMNAAKGGLNSVDRVWMDLWIWKKRRIY